MVFSDTTIVKFGARAFSRPFSYLDQPETVERVDRYVQNLRDELIEEEESIFKVLYMNVTYM